MVNTAGTAEDTPLFCKDGFSPVAPIEGAICYARCPSTVSPLPLLGGYLYLHNRREMFAITAAFENAQRSIPSL